MNALKIWQKATQELTNEFIKKYFKGIETDWYWVGDEIGGVLSINDYFFNLDDMVQFITYNYSVKKMFEYYDFRLEELQKKDGVIINIKNYLKLI